MFDWFLDKLGHNTFQWIFEAWRSLCKLQNDEWSHLVLAHGAKSDPIIHENVLFSFFCRLPNCLPLSPNEALITLTVSRKKKFDLENCIFEKLTFYSSWQEPKFNLHFAFFGITRHEK